MTTQQLWPLPPAPVRETDEQGNWINKDEFLKAAKLFEEALIAMIPRMNRIISLAKDT